MIARWLVAVAAAVVLAPVAAAQATPPVSISTSGEAVGMAVDAQGTAHIAFNDSTVGAAGQPLMYCAWPAAAKTCTPRPILADNESPLAQPPLVQAGPAPGQVTIVSSRANIAVLRSADNGATWSAPANIGTGRWFEGSFGPNGQLALSFRNLGYIEYYERSLLGSPADIGMADLNHGHGVSSATGFSGGIPVLVSGGSHIGMAVSSWSGQGDIHDPATWQGPFNVADSSYFALAGGVRGLWLAYQTSARGGDDRVNARRFNPRTRRFGPLHRVPFGRLGLPALINIGIGQAADGRMVIAWYNAVRDRIEVSASRSGSHWTRARVLATGVTLPGNIRVGLGPTGRGLVVWDGNNDDRIKAAKVSAPALLRQR